MYNSNNVHYKGEENKMPLRAKEDETFSEQLKTPDKSSTSVTGEGKSILKRRKRFPLQDLYTPGEASIPRPSNRRVSFAVSEVKEFRQPANEGTLWGNSYVFDIQKSSSESERTGSSTSEFITSSVSGAGGCIYSQQTIVQETISVSFFPESDSEDDHMHADGENDFEEQIFMHCKEDPKIINKFVDSRSHTNESLLKKCNQVVNTLENKINSKGNYESDKQEFICFDSAEMLNSFEGPQIVRNPSILQERNGTKGQNNQMPSKNSHKQIVNSDKENGDLTSLPDITSPLKLLHKHQLPVCEDLKVVKRRRHEKSEGNCLLKWLAEGPETMKGQNLFEHTKRQSHLSTENTEIMGNDILVSENFTPLNKNIHLNLSKNGDFTGTNEPFSKLSNDHLTKNKLENGVINDSRGDMPCQSKENTSENYQFDVFKKRMDEKFIGTSATTCKGNLSPTMVGGRVLNHVSPDSLPQHFTGTNEKDSSISTEENIFHDMEEISENLSRSVNGCERSPSPTVCGGRILKPVYMTNNMLVNPPDMCDRSNPYTSVERNMIHSTEALSQVSAATGYGSVTPTIAGGRILKETNFSPNILLKHLNDINGKVSSLPAKERIVHDTEEFSENLSKSLNGCEWSPSRIMSGGRISKSVPSSHNMIINPFHRSSKCDSEVSVEGNMNLSEALSYIRPSSPTICDGSVSPTIAGGRILRTNNNSPNTLNKSADESNRKALDIALEGKLMNTVDPSSNNLSGFSNVSETRPSPTMPGGSILKPILMTQNMLVNTLRSNRSNSDISGDGNIFNSTEVLSHKLTVSSAGYGSVSPTIIGGRILKETYVSPNSLFTHLNGTNGNLSSVCAEEKIGHIMEENSEHLSKSSSLCERSPSPTMPRGRILKPIYMSPNSLVNASHRNNPDKSGECKTFNSTEELAYKQPVCATACDGSGSPTFVGGKMLMATNVSPNSLNKPADEGNRKSSAIAVEGKQINTMEASSNNLLVSADVSKTSLSPTMSGGMILKPVEMLPSRLEHHSPRNNRSERDMSVEDNMYNSTETLSHTQPVTATTCDGSVSPTLVGGRILMETNISPNSLNKPAYEDNGKSSAVEGKQINTMEASSNNLLVSAYVSKTSLSPTMSGGMILKPVEMLPSRLEHHSPRNNRSERDMSVEDNMYNSTETLSHTQPVTATTCDGSVSPTLVGGRILMETNISPNSLNKPSYEDNGKSSAVEGKQINTMEASSNNLLVSAYVSKTSLSPTMSGGMILKPVEMLPSRLEHHSPRNSRSERDLSVEGNMYNSTETLSHTQPVTATTCDRSVSPTLVGGRILMATSVSPNSLYKPADEDNGKSSAVEGKQINTMEASSNNLLVSAYVSKTSLSPTMSGGMILKPVEMLPSRLEHHSPRNSRSERDLSVEGNMYNSTETLSHTQPVTATTCDRSVSPTLVGGRILMATSVSPNSLYKPADEDNGKSSAVEGKQINTMEASSNNLLVSAYVSKTSLSPTMSGGMILKPVEMLPSRLEHHSPRNNRSERDMSVEGNMYNSTETLSHTQPVTATTCDGSVSPTLVGGRILMATSVSSNSLYKPADEDNGKSSAVEGKQINTMEASSNNLLVSADVSKTSLSPTMSAGTILKPVEMLPSRLEHHSPRNSRSEHDMSVEGNMYNSTETLSYTQPFTATTCDRSVSPTLVGGRILMETNISPNSLNKPADEDNGKSSAIAVEGKQINTMEASSNNLLVSADVNKASQSPTMPGGTILKPVDRSCSRLEHDSPCLSNCQNGSTYSVAQFITSKNSNSEDHVENVTVQNNGDVDDVLHVPLLSKDQEDLINEDEIYQNVIEHLESNNSVSSNISNVDMIKDESIEPVVEAVESLIKSVQREEIQNDSTIKSFTTYYKDSVKCEVKMFCSELLRKLAFEGRQAYSFAKGEVSQMSKNQFENKPEETPHNTKPLLADNTECMEMQCSKQTFFYDGGSESIQNSSTSEIAKKKCFLTLQYQERSGVQYNKLEDVSDPVTGDKSPEMRLKHKRCASEERNTSTQECTVPEKKTKLYPCNINSTEEFSALTTECSVERWLKQQSGSCSWRIDILSLTKIKLYFFQDTLQFLVEFNSNNFSVKEINFVSNLQGSYQKLFLNNLFMKRLQFNTLKERFPFKKDIPELIAFISAQEEFLKQFNEDWLSLEILQAIKMNNDFWAEFQVESFYLRQLFIVKMNLNKWNGGRLHSKYVQVHQLIGDVDETEIQRLMRAIPEGPHLLRMYIDHLFTYIQKKEKLQCETFSLRKKDIK